MFGGYNPISWKSFNSKRYFAANGSFLFSFDQKTKMPLISPSSQSAILFYNDIGPGFGGNLIISDFCDRNNDSFCSLGREFGIRSFF